MINAQILFFFHQHVKCNGNVKKKLTSGDFRADIEAKQNIYCCFRAADIA